MNQHWSDEQMAAWAMGERSAGTAEHLAVCEPCRREVARMETALAAFRGGVHETANADPFRWSRMRHGVASRAVARVRGLRWAMSGAVALAALSVALLVAPHSKPPVTAHVVASDVSDDQLLNEIQSDLSRSAPEALAPAQSLEQEVAQSQVGQGRKNEANE